jgi:hypothetical protein
MSQPIQWREPDDFVPGDTLTFQRSLPGYTPKDGWSLSYTLTQPQVNGGKPVASFASTPDSSSTYHTVNVLNFAAGLTEGDYILTAEAICAAGGVAPNARHQIYYGELTLLADLADGAAAKPLTTHAQRMITLLEAKLESLEQQSLQETDVQRTRFIIEDRNKTLERLNFYYEKRNYELRVARAVNTGRDQNQIVPLFSGNW